MKYAFNTLSNISHFHCVSQFINNSELDASHRQCHVDVKVYEINIIYFRSFHTSIFRRMRLNFIKKKLITKI